MKVFVTGATGYIGFRVATTLMAKGHTVIGLTRSVEGAARLQTHGINAAHGDLNDSVLLSDMAQNADAVIHAAASRLPADRTKIELTAVNTILNALKESGKPFIFTSGTRVYGDTGSLAVTETSPLNSPTYIAWRVAAEQNMAQSVNHGIHSIIIRPTIVYGHGGSNIIPIWISTARTIGASFYIDNGENWLSAIHVDDLANLYTLALEKAPAGAIYNASAESVQAKALANAISATIGQGGHLRALTLDEIRQMFPPEDPIFTIAEFIKTNNRISGVKARAELGWEPHGATVLDDVCCGSYRSR